MLASTTRFLQKLLAAASAVLLLASTARAQAPAWAAAALNSPDQYYGTSEMWGMTTDASGNVYVTGSFTGSIAFGNTVLTCTLGTPASYGDLYVAKWVPATSTWAWAVRGGGTSDDIGYGIAVSGSSVYVTGYLVNNSSNDNNVTLGGAGASGLPVRGASTTKSTDLVLAKYVDNGTSASLAWVQVAGGTSDDVGYGVAVQGNSVYVTGYFTNNMANTRAVVLGGNGTTAGTTSVLGASATDSQDLLLAKYTDQGSSATMAWTQVGGGSSDDFAVGVAVSGTSIYVTGGYTNDQNNTKEVLFGGNGTTPGTVALKGESSASVRDLLLAKYTDNGATGSYVWGQVGGNSQGAAGQRVVVSGSSVYVAGAFLGNTAGATGMVVGGDGTTPGTVSVNGASATTSTDWLLLKYTDQGSTGLYRWNQVGGGTGTDSGQSVAVSGSSVYVTGYCTNNTANASAVVFGGSGTTAGTVAVPGVGASLSRDVVLAKYTDSGASGSYGWSQVGGGVADDYVNAVAVGGGQVYTAGYVGYTSAVTSYSFGPNLVVPVATPGKRGLVASATDGGSTGSWGTLAAPSNGGSCTPRAVATDASGNVFVTGFFSGQVRFGSTLLTSVSGDLYVAKWVPATGTWAWAVRGGGTGGAAGYGIAVRGSSVYVTGYIINDRANTNNVTFSDTQGNSQPLAGASPTIGSDLLLVKYTDQGSSVALAWAQVAGGSGIDMGNGVAVSGSSVYVTGQLTNNAANANAVVFGGSGLTPGSSPQAGATATTGGDVVLAKYTDNGATATYGWSQVGGGTGFEQGQGVAVSGSSVYVTGFLANDLANTNAVVFGGSGLTAGTRPQAGATTTTAGDLLLAKYTDQGSTGTFQWSQVGGGTQGDVGYGVAVSGSSVYIAGLLRNTIANGQAAVFGGSGLVAGTAPQLGASSNMSNDLVLAKYTDNGTTGSFGWSQVAGGTGNDQVLGVAAVGSRVYITGRFINNVANDNAVVLGGSGTTAGTATQTGPTTLAGTAALLARYTDQGSTGTFDWSRVGGGSGNDIGYGVAVSGQQVWVAAQVYAGATFGSITLAPPSLQGCTAVATLTDAALPLPTHPATAASTGLSVYPNPASHTATLKGADSGALVQVYSVVGRLVLMATADATGTAMLVLPQGLPGGLYLVRSGAGPALRLTVK